MSLALLPVLMLQGFGFAFWPSIALANGALIYFVNVSVAYVNFAPLDNCEQYTKKAVFGLQQAYGEANTTLLNATALRINGPINTTVVVNNGSTNATSELLSCSCGGTLGFQQQLYSLARLARRASWAHCTINT